MVNKEDKETNVKKKDRKRCLAKTKKGKQCKNLENLENNNGLCTCHKEFQPSYKYDEETNTYIELEGTTTKDEKKRKNATASSNVNEVATLIYFKNDEFIFDDLLCKKGGTGIFKGDCSELSYSELANLIEKDESLKRDILIGKKNAIALKEDLKGKIIKKLYWTPNIKPSNINFNNPSDIIIELDNGEFIGYSIKYSNGKDNTPKFNTNIIAFFNKLGPSLDNEVKRIIDNSWKETSNMISSSNAKRAISKFDITKEKFSETTSNNAFTLLALEFQKDNLEFYKKDFYYPFRNTVINYLSKMLVNPQKLKYFLNTIAIYIYGNSIKENTHCPYKLLVGKEKNCSTIKDISDNKLLRSIVTVNNIEDITDIKTLYDGKSQSFIIEFKIKILEEIKLVKIPVTVRTRARGGWSGKSPFLTISGVKIV